MKASTKQKIKTYSIVFQYCEIRVTAYSREEAVLKIQEDLGMSVAPGDLEILD